jgi:lipopolysaccharide export LptBFGC system permease protein LptF
MKEKNLRLRQILGIISLIFIIANIILRFTGVYNDLTFWIVIVLVAIIAWPVMNWLKK